jgi:hypothetical protein
MTVSVVDAVEAVVDVLEWLAHPDGAGYDPEGGCRSCAHGGEPEGDRVVRACPDCVCVAGQKLREAGW